MPRKKVSDEERKKRKKECERKRREKIKADAEKYKLEQIKKHNRYEVQKQKGIVKNARDVSERELRAKRKKWRENSKRYRSKKKFLTNLRDSSPPTSDDEMDIENRQPVPTPDVNNGPISTILKSTPNSTPGSSRQNLRGRRVMIGNRAKCYRRIKKVERENANLRTKLECYKKKFYRLKNKRKGKLTPVTKVNQMLQNHSVPPNVKRRLLFGEVINQELSTNFTELKDNKSKQIFTKAVKGTLLGKYRLLKEASGFLPYKLYKSNKKRTDTLTHYERKKNTKLSETRKNLTKFFVSDENSRLCPGKKDTITKRGVKKQKRYLNSSLKILFYDFKKNHPVQISYATFCKERPFWVVPPKTSGRDTCLCIQHENMNLLVSSLCRRNILREKNIDQILSKLCCDKNNENCLNRKCINCNTNKLLFYQTDNMKMETYHYEQWVTKKETRVSAKTKKEIVVQRTVKEKIAAKPDDIIVKLNSSLPKMFRHTLNIYHQFAAIKQLKGQLQEHEILFHVDYSENYSCKYAQEAQSVHFGASREQITLHTGMMYYMKEKQGFCTVSSSLRHDPSAIMAHLQPILEHYLNTFQERGLNKITSIHFLSDSPSTQYRNRKLFFFLQNVFPKLFPNVTKITWNYSESGHGKGAPDGIGAVVKRCADQLVAHNHDINTFDAFTSAIKTNIKNLIIRTVDEAEIEKFDTFLPANIKGCKGTMLTHQVTWRRDDQRLFLNTLSCFECDLRECSHYNILKVPSTSINIDALPEPEYSPVTTTGVPRADSVDTDMSSQIRGLYMKNEWVAAIYDDAWYPGIIEDINGENVTINFMSRSGKCFHWPGSADRQILTQAGILCKLDLPPVPVSNRLFKVPNSEKINDMCLNH